MDERGGEEGRGEGGRKRKKGRVRGKEGGEGGR